ncbi:MAG: hypothetical protein CMJ89_05945 [Planctomycetes bacterium]|nr:hypothetical protein [Planctomycetota bacterium]
MGYGIAYVYLLQCADDVHMCDEHMALVRYEMLLMHTAVTFLSRFFPTGVRDALLLSLDDSSCRQHATCQLQR